MLSLVHIGLQQWLLLHISKQPPLSGCRVKFSGDADLDQQMLRERVWQEVMARAGKPFADLINIPTQLVKDLLDMKY